MSIRFRIIWSSSSSMISSFVVLWIFFQISQRCLTDELPTCQPRDFHYEFTECDENGGRWRVSVPKPGYCVGGAPNPPTRVSDCRTSCEAGTYFNRSTLECVSCPPGTYSLGGGVRFEQWERFPQGFHASSEPFETSFRLLHRFATDSSSPANCSEFGWRPQHNFVSSVGGPCASALSYSVKLVKPGLLSYTYQYTDQSVLFNFEAQNEQCQSIEDVEKYKWPRTTEEGKWRTATVQLKAGLNVLYWKTIGMGFSELRSSSKPRPVRIRRIEISGVAYTSECTPCAPGSYSSSGSKQCTACPENTYADSGSSDCTPCNPSTEYAPSGSATCLLRPPCTRQDWYETHEPCDEHHQTRPIFRWVEPKICREDVPGAAHLPQGSEPMSCPPCNPGMEYANDSMCAFCPKDHYSDGSEACRPCPPSTAPNYGLFFNWWPELPPGMFSRCMSLEEGACSSRYAWVASGDHVRTLTSRSGASPSESYLVLSLEVPGFREGAGGTVSFTFELDCEAPCTLVFMVGSTRRPVTEIQNWVGKTSKQHFSYDVTIDDAYTFNWVFQRSANSSSSDDVAKIFDIEVLNTISGGASECLACPQGTEAQGSVQRCIPCPPGQYAQVDRGGDCEPCPDGTYAWRGKECRPCGPGLVPLEGGRLCGTDCRIQLSDGTQFDLTLLPKFVEVRGNPLFTASGTQYFHAFNISLCGRSATCRNNVTYHSLDPQAEEAVTAFVCRATVVPSQGGAAGNIPLVTQSVSLGDTLVGVTTKHRLGNIEVPKDFLDTAEGHSDIHFFYTSSEKTQACAEGRSATVTLRCDSSLEGKAGSLTPPASCSDGTCDGCNFHFLWRTSIACRLCNDSDYQVVRGECVNSQRTLHYIRPRGCVSGGQAVSRSQPCRVALPLELQALVGASVALGLLPLALVVYFWRKNRRLEFKYMKLVQSSSAKECELPSAESCGVDEEEEDEEQGRGDGVTICDKKRGFFGRFGTIRVGGNRAYKWDSETEALEGSWTPAN